ncbi:MAG: ATP synthase F0 subunit C [Oligoflexia bacterium]|nr:ATP synthase F0 subunit C [Oligoflexia bacterium]
MKQILIALCFLPLSSLAAEMATNGAEDAGLKALAAAVAISLGALGGALGQGRVAASAMEGIARNPQASKSMFVPFMVALAMIESLVLFCLVIAMIKT